MADYCHSSTEGDNTGKADVFFAGTGSVSRRVRRLSITAVRQFADNLAGCRDSDVIKDG